MARTFTFKSLKPPPASKSKKEPVVDVRVPSPLEPLPLAYTLPVNSIDPKTGKKVMPRSPGRPKKDPNAPPPPPAPMDQVQRLVQKTAIMTDEQIVSRAQEIEAEQADAGLERYAAGGPMDEMSALCYRLASRGLTTNQIAAQMNITPDKVRRHQDRLMKFLRLDPKMLDVGYYMGESLAFYAEIRQMALLATSSDKNPAGIKLRAMEVALNAENQKNEFLTKIGVYSPAVVDRVERWIINTTEQMTAPPVTGQRVNLAAAIGRALAKRSVMHTDATDVGL